MAPVPTIMIFMFFSACFWKRKHFHCRTFRIQEHKSLIYGPFRDSFWIRLVASGTAGLQVTEITAAWILEDPQTEERDHGQDVIENIRLKLLVVDPVDVIAEDVDLQRQSLFPRGKLTDHEGPLIRLFMNLRMLLQVMLDVVAKDSDVGEAAPV